MLTRFRPILPLMQRPQKVLALQKIPTMTAKMTTPPPATQALLEDIPSVIKRVIETEADGDWKKLDIEWGIWAERESIKRANAPQDHQ